MSLNIAIAATMIGTYAAGLLHRETTIHRTLGPRTLIILSALASAGLPGC
jgi:hypothetical protein